MPPEARSSIGAAAGVVARRDLPLLAKKNREGGGVWCRAGSRRTALARLAPGVVVLRAVREPRRSAVRRLASTAERLLFSGYLRRIYF